MGYGRPWMMFGAGHETLPKGDKFSSRKKPGTPVPCVQKPRAKLIQLPQHANSFVGFVFSERL